MSVGLEDPEILFVSSDSQDIWSAASHPLLRTRLFVSPVVVAPNDDFISGVFS